MGLFRRSAVPTAPPPPSDEDLLEIIGTVTGLQALFVDVSESDERLLAEALAEADRRGLL